MEEKLYFNNTKGVKLSGILLNPLGDKTKPIVILCHGYNSAKDHSTYTGLARKLAEAGISSFRFDFFAHGESEGLFEELTQTIAVEDTLKAIEFVKSLGYLRIGLFGSSFGGLAAIMAAAKCDDLFVLALKAPVSSYFELREFADKGYVSRWKQDGYNFLENKRLNYSFYEDIKNNVAYDVADKIKVPTVIVHGDADRDVPVAQSEKLSKLIANCKLHIIRGASHRFREGDSNREMMERLTTFIVENSR